MAPPQEVDIIIVGAGAAGCVVAGRLAKADPNLSIAIVESGIDNVDLASSIQPAMYISHLAPTSTTASFYVSNPSEALGGRAAIVPVGHAVGGGSAINFMMYTRASASDYDDWKQEGWSYNDLLPMARKIETFHPDEGQDPKLHGTSGPLHVSYGGHQSEIGRQFVKATADCYDIPFTNDLQDFKTGHAVSKWAKYISPTTGHRQDAAHGYVHPIIKSQTNLHLLPESKTIRVLFDTDKKAVGIEYCHNPLARASLDPANPPVVGEVKTMKARKLVVVSAGALGTPQILERSGVGAKDRLEKLGIEVVVDLPAVGATYEDHQLSLATYCVDPDEDTLDEYLRGNPEVHGKVVPQWLQTGQGLVATNIIDAGMKARPTEAEVASMGPDFQKVWNSYFKHALDKPVMFGGALSGFLGDHKIIPPGRYMMMGMFLTYPQSRGSIHITSKDPFVAPNFDAGLLSHPADMAPQVWMYKKLREIARRMPTYRGELGPAHPKFLETSGARCVEYDASKKGRPVVDLVYSAEDDAAIESWLRENVNTTWHSMATCPMKAQSAGGVVDARLNVYGTKGLKLADLSICPSNAGSNTYNVALTVGEKAASIIGEDLGITV